MSLTEKLHNLLHQNILTEWVVVMNVASVTPENSWGINCVILEGPMVNSDAGEGVFWKTGLFKMIHLLKSLGMFELAREDLGT